MNTSPLKASVERVVRVWKLFSLAARLLEEPQPPFTDSADVLLYTRCPECNGTLRPYCGRAVFPDCSPPEVRRFVGFECVTNAHLPLPSLGCGFQFEVAAEVTT